MKIDFPIIDSEDAEYGLMGCYTGLLISYAKWKNLQYDWVFGESWNFNFYRDTNYPGTLNNNVGIAKTNIEENLKSICGLTIKNNCVEQHKLWDFIKSEIDKNLPVCIKTDVFWCPWSMHYKRIHAPHAFIVVGYDESGNLICSDYAPRHIEIVLKKENLFAGIDSCITFDSENKLCENDSEKIYISAICKLREEKHTQMIGSFASFLDSEFDMELQMKRFNNNRMDMPPLWTLLEVSGGRILFSRFLKMYMQKSGICELRNICEKLIDASRKWTVIQRFFSKALFSQDEKFITKTVKCLYEIEKYENMILDELCKY